MSKQEENIAETIETKIEDTGNDDPETDKSEKHTAKTKAAEKKNTATPDDLIKDKANNQFHASENTANIQIFLQNANFNGGTGWKQVLDLMDINTGDDKKYDLKKEEDCAEFFRTCKNREYITLAIVLAVFETVSIGELDKLKEVLMECLPSMIQLDKEGKEIHIPQSNPYLSLNTVLSVIGGKMFITEEGEQCIGYGEGSERVLNNIWIQFPALRKPIMTWLLKTNAAFEYRSDLEAYQITTAFVRIITEDFAYAEKQIFIRLYSNQKNVGLLARISMELLKKSELKQAASDMVLQWAESDSEWLWKAAFLVYSYVNADDYDSRLKQALTDTVKKKFMGLNNTDLGFITVSAFYFTKIRQLIAEIFDFLYRVSDRQAWKQLAYTYICIIRYGYYRISKHLTDLPFVVCDSKEQLKCMVPILKYVMSRYDLRRQLYCILRVYLEEIADYDISRNTISYITAYFYSLAGNDEDFRRDILLFLKECNGRAAEAVYQKLTEIYKSTGGRRK